MSMEHLCEPTGWTFVLSQLNMFVLTAGTAYISLLSVYKYSFLISSNIHGVHMYALLLFGNFGDHKNLKPNIVDNVTDFNSNNLPPKKRLINSYKMYTCGWSSHGTIHLVHQESLISSVYKTFENLSLDIFWPSLDFSVFVSCSVVVGFQLWSCSSWYSYVYGIWQHWKITASW